MTDDGARSNGLDDPEVRAWLARLDTEAAVLPEDRRAELRATVEEYLADATAGAGTDEERAAVARASPSSGRPRRSSPRPAGTPCPPVDAVDAGRRPARPRRVPRGWRARPSTLLAASVVLALVPATEAVAPVPWFVGTLLVLLSRRWSVGRQGPGRGRVRGARRAASSCSAATSCRRAPASSCPCVARGPLGARRGPAAAARPLPPRAGSRPADALTLPPRSRRTPHDIRGGAEPTPHEGGPPGGRPPSCGAVVAGRLRSPCRPCRRHRAWPVRPSPACRR